MSFIKTCNSGGGGGGGGGGSNTPVEDSTFDSTITGTVGGGNLVFTLSATPISESLSLYVRGLRQTKTAHYTRAGAVITFSSAPENGVENETGEDDIIDATYLVV